MVHQHSNLFFPGLIFFFIICFLPFLEGGAHPTSLFIVHTLIFILLAFIGYKIFKRVIISFDMPFISILFLPFLIFMFIRSFFTPYFFASFLSFWEVLIFFILFLLTYYFSKNEIFIRWLLLFFVLSFFFQSLLIQLFYFSSGQERTAVYFFNPNHLAAYLSMGFYISAPFLMLKLSGKKKAILLKIGIIVFLLILLSSMALQKSRGALLSFPVAFLFFLFLLRRKMTRKEFLSFIIVAILIIALGSLLIYQRFEGGGDIYKYERIRIWRASLSLFFDHSLLGIGPGMFEYLSAHYQFPQLQSLIKYGKRFTMPHSDYILLLTELGLFGSILLLIPFFYGIGNLFKKSRLLGRENFHFFGWSFPLKESIMCALLVLIIQGFFDNLTERPAIYMSFAILLGVLFSRISEDNAEEIDLSYLSRTVLFAVISLISIIYLYYFAVFSPYLADRIIQEAYRLRAQDKEEEAIQWCSKAIFFNRIHPDYYNFRGEYYLNAIKNEKFHPDLFFLCDRDLSQAYQWNSVKALYPLNKAVLYQELFYKNIYPEESFHRALFFYHEAERLAAKDPFIPYECASLNFAVKNYDHAIKEIKNSLDIEPYFLQAQLFLAENYRVIGEKEKARTIIENMQEKFKDLEGYRLQNDYELKILDYDRTEYARICQELEIKP